MPQKSKREEKRREKSGKIRDIERQINTKQRLSIERNNGLERLGEKG